MPLRSFCRRAPLAGVARIARASFLALALATVTVLSAAPQAAAADAWTEIGSDRADPLTESQGLASVEVPAGSANRYTGIGTIPLSVSVRGWNHVGDPDATYGGYYVEPYQSDSKGLEDVPGAGARRRLVGVRPCARPGRGPEQLLGRDHAGQPVDALGRVGHHDPVPRLPDPGREREHLALRRSPPGVDRPPRPRRARRPGLRLHRPDDPAVLLDDPAGTLFGITKPLLQIDLSAQPNGASDVTGHVTALRQLPLRSSCSGSFEAEGVDYDRRSGTLRVIVVSPGFCVLTDSKTYCFTRG